MPQYACFSALGYAVHSGTAAPSAGLALPPHRPIEPTQETRIKRPFRPTAYAGNVTIRTLHEGKPEQLQMSQNGKWLGADCGYIRALPAGR